MKIARRIIFISLYVLILYFLYLIVLGPVSFLGKRGLLEWVPEGIRHAVELSVKPVEVIPYTRDIYHGYLKIWNGSGELEL